jgi:AcrR family transcriptional regulator
VTRLTVYNQFGSRRAVLEAVFDQVALRGGLHRLAAAVALPDPHAAVREVIAIFCDFWSFDPGALGLLHAAGSSNQEFAASVTERNERRRRLFAAVVRRMGLGAKKQKDLVDTLFALTSFAFFAQLANEGRSAAAAGRIIQGLASDAVRRARA